MTKNQILGKIVEEVDKEIKNNTSKQGWHFDEYTEGYLDALKNIKTFLDTLEVKEVDLEKELDFVKDAYYYFTSDERSSMKKVAKHFFELGLKTQKGE